MSNEWRSMDSAPKDGTPILGWCVHEADPYEEETTGYLTPYGANCEGERHVDDGPHVLVWLDEYEDDDGWGTPSYIVPGGWFTTGTQFEEVGNPVVWMPIPEYKP